MTLTQARAAFRALADELVEAKFAGETLWLLDEQEPWLGGDLAEEANLRLLPRYDTYLLGYRDRDLSVPAAYARKDPSRRRIPAPGGAGGRVGGRDLANGPPGGPAKRDRRTVRAPEG